MVMTHCVSYIFTPVELLHVFYRHCHKKKSCFIRIYVIHLRSSVQWEMSWRALWKSCSVPQLRLEGNLDDKHLEKLSEKMTNGGKLMMHKNLNTPSLSLAAVAASHSFLPFCVGVSHKILLQEVKVSGYGMAKCKMD